jgi:RHS repeat-associated protein
MPNPQARLLGAADSPGDVCGSAELGDRPGITVGQRANGGHGRRRVQHPQHPHVADTTTNYGYDAQGRLSCATSLTVSVSDCESSGYYYQYDADGNMTTKETNGSAVTYTYNASDEMTTSPSAYDNAGDQTELSSGTTLGYNNFAQTTSMKLSGGSTDTYSYTGPGQNQLTSGAGTTVQNSSILGVTAINTGGTVSYLTRDSSGNLISLRTGGTAYYYLLDGNNSVIGLINTAGASAASYTYAPYGSLTSGTPTGIAATNPFRYDSGYQTADGLYHYGARYYNPANGRWTQLDPSGRNRGYAFADDDPVNESDPSGQLTFGPFPATTAFLAGLALTNGESIGGIVSSILGSIGALGALYLNAIGGALLDCANKIYNEY